MVATLRTDDKLSKQYSKKKRKTGISDSQTCNFIVVPAPEQEVEHSLDFCHGVQNKASKQGGSVLGLLTTSLRELHDHDGSDLYLLELLLAITTDQSESKLLAENLLAEFKTLGSVLAAPIIKLNKVLGVGSPIIGLLKLVQRTMFSVAQAKIRGTPLISNSIQLEEYLKFTMRYEANEQFRVLYLNTSNHLISDQVLSRGTVKHTEVNVREVVTRGLSLNASALILVHNHPSGHCKPSNDDIVITNALHPILSAVEIVLHDHIIIGKEYWFSFKMHDLIQKL